MITFIQLMCTYVSAITYIYLGTCIIMWHVCMCHHLVYVDKPTTRFFLLSQYAHLKIVT